MYINAANEICREIKSINLSIIKSYICQGMAWQAIVVPFFVCLNFHKFPSTPRHENEMKSFLHIIALSSTPTTAAAATNITIMIASLQIIQRKIKLSYRIFSSLYNEKNIKKLLPVFCENV